MEEEINLFDKYLSDEMSPSEKENFENSLATSSELKARFEEYIGFSKTLHDGVEYTKITDKLTSIHQELYPLKMAFWKKRQFIIPFSVAASIALVLFLNPFGYGDQQAETNMGYTPLANASEMAVTEETSPENPLSQDGIQKDQVNKSLDLIDELDFISTQPKGTAFLISQQGYFLSSKHLVEGKKMVILQQKELNKTFQVEVVYTDSLIDLALLKCSDELALSFDKIPYQLAKKPAILGEDLFTLGYPKKTITFTKGVLSSETGFESDSDYIEISMPSNPGISGAPLFNCQGKIIGLMTAQNSLKQAVSYSVSYENIKKTLESLSKELAFDLFSSENKTLRNAKIPQLTQVYRSFIFEVH